MRNIIWICISRLFEDIFSLDTANIVNRENLPVTFPERANFYAFIPRKILAKKKKKKTVLLPKWGLFLKEKIAPRGREQILSFKNNPYNTGEKYFMSGDLPFLKQVSKRIYVMA